MLVRDQTGYELEIPDDPQRVISLVPSQTEMLIDLGLGERLVGRTKFCVHPRKEVNHIPVVGGTKNYRHEVIDTLQPDLIIGNLEENEKEGIETLRKKYPVWLSDIRDMSAATELFTTMGEYFKAEDRARFYLECLEERFIDFSEVRPVPSVYLIWKNPWMAAGTNTFINEMMNLSGFSNLVSTERYPELSLMDLKQLGPELIMLSSEPYPFKEQHVLELKNEFPNARVIWVDGEMFSWYGTRLIKAMDYLQELREQLD